MFTLEHGLDLLSNPIAAGGTSAVSTLGVAAMVQVPETPAGWIPYVITVLGPVLTLVASRLLAANAARKRVEASRMKERALAKKNDNNPANDAEAEAELDRAAALKAEADALEALKPGE